LSLKVRILEKIYPTNSPQLSIPHRRKHEEYWIRVLLPRMDSIGNFSSPGSNSVNVMRLFPASSRRKRSHGHRHYSPPNLYNFSIDSLITLIEKLLAVHHIRAKLYSLPLKFSIKVSRISCLIPVHQKIQSLVVLKRIPDFAEVELDTLWLGDRYQVIHSENNI